MLRFFTEIMRIRVREYKHPVVAVDAAESSPHVARLTGVTRWIDVAGTHGLANLKARGHCGGSAGRPPFGRQCCRLLAGKRRNRHGRSCSRLAAVEFSGRDKG